MEDTLIVILILAILYKIATKPVVYRNLAEKFENTITKLLNKSKKYMPENFADATTKVKQLFTNTYSGPACMTRGIAPPECECPLEKLKAGECPRACGFNRRREPLYQETCQNLNNPNGAIITN